MQSSSALPHPYPRAVGPPNLRWSSCWTSISPPALISHIILYSLPNPLHNLPIPPSASRPRPGTPFLYLRAQYSSPPSPNRLRHRIPSPPYIHTQCVPKQLSWCLPLVALELPYLSRSKNCHDAGPILGLKLLGRINDDETNGARGIYRR